MCWMHAWLNIHYASDFLSTYIYIILSWRGHQYIIHIYCGMCFHSYILYVHQYIPQKRQHCLRLFLPSFIVIHISICHYNSILIISIYYAASCYFAATDRLFLCLSFLCIQNICMYVYTIFCTLFLLLLLFFILFVILILNNLFFFRVSFLFFAL